MSGTDIDVAIIGGGSAGVAAARHLQGLKPDLSMRIFEAGHRFGGRAHTVSVGPLGTPVDLGCGWLHGGRDNLWAVIASRMGFTLDRTRAPWDGGERLIGNTTGDQTQSREALDTFFERSEQPLDLGTDKPLSDLLTPGASWNGLIGAIGTFINGTELPHASLLDYQRYDPGRGPDPRVREGYGRLVESYAVGLPVVFDTPVSRIRHGGAELIIETSKGPVRAHAAVITAATDVMASGALQFDPPLPDKVAAAAALPLGLANKLFLSVPSAIELPAERHLMGLDDAERTGSYHLRPFGHPVIECYYGGDLARALERGGVRASTDFAHAELARHLGHEIVAQFEPLAFSGWAGTPYIGGSYSFARPGAADKRAVLAQAVDNRMFFAGEACSPHRFSTAHGAFETGVAAAEALVAALARR